MGKIQSSVAIGVITALCGAGTLGWWVLPFAVGNVIFIHEFLTMKGH